MSINFSNLCFLDFETTGKNPKGCQPVSIGAVMIDPRKLTLLENGVFYSTISYIEDVETYGLDPIEEDAFYVNKLDPEEIKKSPSLKVVWNNFSNWVNYFNPKKDEWKAPILGAFNLPYENAIINRIMNGHHDGKLVMKNKRPSKDKMKSMSPKEVAAAFDTYKEPWKFSSKWLFNKNKQIDVAQTTFEWMESFVEPRSASLDALKAHLGFSSDKAHNALVDAFYTAEIWCRFQSIQRKVSIQTDFDTENSTILPIWDTVIPIFEKMQKTLEK